jgi:hypothetical protein
MRLTSTVADYQKLAGCQAGTLPSRPGYWLGDLLAQRWLARHSLREKCPR